MKIMSNLRQQIGDVHRFGDGDFHKYCWLDISKLNQSQLVAIIHKYDITNVIDIRSYPVFRRPAFNSPQLMSYFKSSDILYNPISPLNIDKKNRSYIRNLIRNSKSFSQNYFFLFLFDSTGGGSSEKKRIIHYLDNAKNLQHFLITG